MIWWGEPSPFRKTKKRRKHRDPHDCFLWEPEKWFRQSFTVCSAQILFQQIRYPAAQQKTAHQKNLLNRLEYRGLNRWKIYWPNLHLFWCWDVNRSRSKTFPESISKSSAGCLVLSIMAGITTHKLSEAFPEARNIVRSMPNTPGQIGHGITGYLFAKTSSDEDRSIIEKILSSLGSVYELREEEDLDRITAISGSGPAYVFEFTCALEEAAVLLDYPENWAVKSPWAR